MDQEQDVIGLKTSISDAAWDIIKNNGLEAFNESISIPEIEKNIETPSFTSPSVPDISKIKVPDQLLKGFISENTEKTPIKQIINKTSPNNSFLTESELKVLQEAQKIISKVLEMTTCGSIGVNMAGSTPKPKKIKAVKYKSSLKKKKKTLKVLNKLEQYD